MNIISGHNYIKVSLLRAGISTHKFDVIGISETYLDSDTSDDDNILLICLYLLQTLTRFQIIKYSLIEGVHEF